MPSERTRKEMSVLTIGIDVGGTNLRAAVVDEQGQVLDYAQTPTPSSIRALELALDRTVTELMARNEIAAVGLAVAAFVSRDRSTIQFAAHLPWRNAPIGAEMSARHGVPVFLEHDANAAAWGEHCFGAASGAEITVLVAIGTGIGIGLLIDGQLYRGTHGVAPELGHLQVVSHGRRCPCGKHGCWEQYCSGTALVNTAIELLATNPAHSTILARQEAADPGSLTGRRVTAAAQDDDPLALEVMADFARWLGLGLAIVSDVFDPALIVIAGGVASAANLFLDEARENYARSATGAGYRPLARVRATQLGADASIIGAAELARDAWTREQVHGQT